MQRARLLGLLAVLMVTASSISADTAAQVPMRPWTITVDVASTKADGSAWDAFGGAPDIALYGVSAGGSGCVLEDDAMVRCQDAFTCSFTVRLPDTFSATIWDVDVAADDLIGTCYVDHPGAYRCGRASITAY